MPYVQSSEVAKYHAGSYEDRMQQLKAAVEAQHGKAVRLLATHVEHALVVDEDGQFLRANYKRGKQGLTVSLAAADINVVGEDDLFAFVAGEIRSIVESGARGERPDRTRVRDLCSLVQPGEVYTLGAALLGIAEAATDGWMGKLEEAQAAAESPLAARVPTTRYTQLPDGRLSEFVEELRDSMRELAGVCAGVVDEISPLVFHEDDERSAVRQSLIAEAQAASCLLVKAEKLMASSDAQRTAEAHDNLAERARKMAAVSAWLRARNDDEE